MTHPKQHQRQYQLRHLAEPSTSDLLGEEDRAREREKKRERERDMAHKVFILLCLFLAFDASHAKLEVITDTSTVVVKPGEAVHLKCLLKVEKLPMDMKNFMVQWFTRGKQVAEYDNKITIDKPGLSMSEEALKKGDATLTIASVTAEHAGNYRCYVYYASGSSMKQTVLEVNDPTKPKEEDADLPFVLSETNLYKKVDAVLDKVGVIHTKLDLLIKDVEKCSAQRLPKSAK
ncbi:hypothetical protein FKM82_019991 [Ascaphus truei]